MKSILIIEDCKFTTVTLKEILKNTEYTVVGQATTGQQGIEMALDLEPDIITVDNMLPDMNGIELIKQLKELMDAAKILMISSINSENVVNEALQNGASEYLVKPINSRQLKESLSLL